MKKRSRSKLMLAMIMVVAMLLSQIPMIAYAAGSIEPGKGYREEGGNPVYLGEGAPEFVVLKDGQFNGQLILWRPVEPTEGMDSYGRTWENYYKSKIQNATNTTNPPWINVSESAIIYIYGNTHYKAGNHEYWVELRQDGYYACKTGDNISNTLWIAGAPEDPVPQHKCNIVYTLVKAVSADEAIWYSGVDNPLVLNAPAVVYYRITVTAECTTNDATTCPGLTAHTVWIGDSVNGAAEVREAVDLNSSNGFIGVWEYTSAAEITDVTVNTANVYETEDSQDPLTDDADAKVVVDEPAHDHGFIYSVEKLVRAVGSDEWKDIEMIYALNTPVEYQITARAQCVDCADPESLPSVLEVAFDDTFEDLSAYTTLERDGDTNAYVLVITYTISNLTAVSDIATSKSAVNVVELYAEDELQDDDDATVNYGHQHSFIYGIEKYVWDNTLETPAWDKDTTIHSAGTVYYAVFLSARCYDDDCNGDGLPATLTVYLEDDLYGDANGTYTLTLNTETGVYSASETYETELAPVDFENGDIVNTATIYKDSTKEDELDDSSATVSYEHVHDFNYTVKKEVSANGEDGWINYTDEGALPLVVTEPDTTVYFRVTVTATCTDDCDAETITLYVVDTLNGEETLYAGDIVLTNNGEGLFTGVLQYEEGNDALAGFKYKITENTENVAVLYDEVDGEKLGEDDEKVLYDDGGHVFAYTVTKEVSLNGETGWAPAVSAEAESVTAYYRITITALCIEEGECDLEDLPESLVVSLVDNRYGGINGEYTLYPETNDAGDVIYVLRLSNGSSYIFYNTVVSADVINTVTITDDSGGTWNDTAAVDLTAPLTPPRTPPLTPPNTPPEPPIVITEQESPLEELDIIDVDIPLTALPPEEEEMLIEEEPIPLGMPKTGITAEGAAFGLMGLMGIAAGAGIMVGLKKKEQQ